MLFRDDINISIDKYAYMLYKALPHPGVYEIVVDGVAQTQEWACGPPIHGRAKAGPYRNIRPAEADARTLRCPPCKVGPLQRFHTPRALAVPKLIPNVAVTYLGATLSEQASQAGLAHQCCECCSCCRGMRR